MPVELAAAGYRALASHVERRKGIELSGIWDAGDHSILLLHRRVGSSCFHTAEFERRPAVLVEIGENRRGLDGFGRETQRRLGRTVPAASGTGAPSAVTRTLHTPL